MAKYNIRVRAAGMDAELANVFFSNDSGAPALPVTIYQTDAEGYTTIEGAGKYITASFATAKKTIATPLNSKDWIYIDIDTPLLPEYVANSKKNEAKVKSKLPIILLICGLALLAIGGALYYKYGRKNK